MVDDQTGDECGCISRELQFCTRYRGEHSGESIGDAAGLECFEIVVVTRQSPAGAHRDSLAEVGCFLDVCNS